MLPIELAPRYATPSQAPDAGSFARRHAPSASRPLASQPWTGADERAAVRRALGIALGFFAILVVTVSITVALAPSTSALFALAGG